PHGRAGGEGERDDEDALLAASPSLWLAHPDDQRRVPLDLDREVEGEAAAVPGRVDEGSGQRVRALAQRARREGDGGTGDLSGRGRPVEARVPHRRNRLARDED